jgi:hypothetical protein
MEKEVKEDAYDDKALLGGMEMAVVTGIRADNDVVETTLVVAELLISWLSPVWEMVGPVARTDAELAKAKVRAKATVEERIMKLRLFWIRILKAEVNVCLKRKEGGENDWW